MVRTIGNVRFMLYFASRFSYPENSCPAGAGRESASKESDVIANSSLSE